MEGVVSPPRATSVHDHVQARRRRRPLSIPTSGRYGYVLRYACDIPKSIHIHNFNYLSIGIKVSSSSQVDTTQMKLARLDRT